MILTLVFTIFLYIHLVIAVKNDREVSKWMYKIGHALRGRIGKYYDFTDKSVLNEVNFYIIDIVILNIAVYFIFYGKYFPNNDIAFWLFAEFFIVIVARLVVGYGKLIFSFLLPLIRKKEFDCRDSAASNAVMRMSLMSIFACILTINMTGLPVKAPVVQAGEYKIVIGQTTADDLLSNGFTFIGGLNVEKKANDIIENKRDSHFYFGEMVELVKDGKGYGYVNLTPRYKDEEKLKDCVITYYGITSKSKMFNYIKICDKNISELSIDNLKKEDMRDIFSIYPISYEEIKVNEFFSLRMQTYPYMLWKKYTIEINFFSEDEMNQFEVFAQHTLWE